MNWTEGNLARHARGGRGKELLKRQKQHFAKVRSGHVNNTKSPPRPFRDEVKSLTDHLGRHSQRTEGFAVNGSDRGQKRGSVSQQCHDAPGLSTEVEQYLNLRSLDPSPVHIQGSAAKRLRLLNKGDWTGVDRQKPIQLQFGQCKQDARSPAQSRKEHRRQRPRVPIRHVLGERYDALMKGKRLFCETRPKPDSIRIRVGSQDMRIGGSSVTVRPIAEKRDATASPHHSSMPLGNGGYSRSSSSHESRSHRVRHTRASIEHSTFTNHNGGKAHLRRGLRLGANSSSPSPGILQPSPRRMHNIILDPLLRSLSPGSDADDSLIAQMGRVQPVVLPELHEENNKWVQLMCPSGRGLSTDESRAPTLLGLDVSPGVSAIDVKVTSLGQPCPETQAEEHNSPHSSSETTIALSTECSTMKTGCVPEARITRVSILPGFDEPLIAARIRPDWGPQPMPASFKRENNQAPHCRETMPALASGPVVDQQKSLANDRKSEYDAWIKSFLSSEDSDGSFNEQALHDARLDAARAIQCARSKETPYAEDSHESVVFKNPLGAVVSTARDVASHAATHGSVFSSIETGSPSIDSAEETRGYRPSASIRANKSMSADISEDDSRNHEGKHARASSSGQLNGLTPQGPSAQCSDSDKELEAVMIESDTSIRGNAPASTTYATQKPSILKPDSAYHISSVAAEPAQSSSSDSHKYAFRFAAPRLFVGKRATQSAPGTHKPATLATVRGWKGRSRGERLRGVNHGRTSIRHLPNYDGDPIEEFSDEVNLIVCPKSPPLFGLLQTE